jgi:hypothetical protein
VLSHCIYCYAGRYYTECHYAECRGAFRGPIVPFKEFQMDLLLLLLSLCPVANNLKLFMTVITNFCNKLVCLSMASISSLV